MRNAQLGLACITLGLLATLAGTHAAEQNLLKNPSFEEIGPDGVPSAWQRQYNKKLSGPFMVVEDAHEGKKAVCLLTEEWNYLRPQFVTQTVKLPAGTKSVCLSAYCKGQGQVNLAFRFLKGGQPHTAKTIKKSFGTVQQPKETVSCLSLGQTYERHAVRAAAPEGADGVLVKLGNTIGPLNRLNVWGKAWIDSASLSVSSEAVPETEPTHALIEKLAKDKALRDVARDAQLQLRPPSFAPRLLVDGDTETAPSFMGGVGRTAVHDFRFTNPVPIQRLALYLPNKWAKVSDLVVRGDADGDGVFEKVLARAAHLVDKGWLVFEPEKTPVSAIRIQALKGTRLTNYRKAGAGISEVKILVTPADYNQARAKAPLFRRASRPRRGVPQLALRRTKVDLPPLKKARFKRMVCADLWMWGIHGANKKEVPENKPEWKAANCTRNETFERTLEIVKRMDCTGVLIDLTVSVSRDLMPWPSKVCNSTKENFLKAVVDRLHAEGLEVYTELLHNITPFERVKWHYPQEETSRYPGMKQYPSIIHGTHYRDNFLTICDEMMACGLDGLGISFDEHYYKGHFMETFPKDDPGRALYRKRFGYDLPAHEEDTLKYRQWITMRHEGLADLFGFWIRALKKKYPQLHTSTMFMYPTAGYSYITETGVPLDVMGARSGISEIGSDYQDPYGIYLGAAANGWRRGTMLHNGDMWPHPLPKPPLHFYRTSLWNIMYGSGSTNYWRYNYVADYGHVPALTRTYRLIRDLEALGVWDARPPKQIALLSSRASLDWWQVKSWWGKHEDPSWDRGLESQRGWYADQSVFYILQKNGYPFDWMYLDYPDKLRDLEQYKVILLPFAYAVSKAAATRLKAAADKGAKVILFDGRMGPTDEWGEPHPAPVLKPLVDAGQAVVFNEDIRDVGNTDWLAERTMKIIDETLGEAQALKLNRYGRNIDATLLETSPTERFVFLINNEKKIATVDLALGLPAGTYTMRVRDENGWYEAALGGTTRLGHTALRNVRLTMANEQPMVLHIRPAK